MNIDENAASALPTQIPIFPLPNALLLTGGHRHQNQFPTPDLLVFLYFHARISAVLANFCLAFLEVLPLANGYQASAAYSGLGGVLYGGHKTVFFLRVKGSLPA